MTAPIHPVPVVAIDGIDVASGPGPDGAPDDLIVVDGLTVTWGRDEVVAQPEPATGTLELFDPSGTWATSSNLGGKRVTLSWTADVDGVPTRKVFFRGRVGTPYKVRRKTVITPAGRRIDGAVVELPLVSILVDLANLKPSVDWPEETVEQRRARILAAANASTASGRDSPILAGLDVRDFWEPPHMAPVLAKDQVSLYEHLVTLFDSTGADRMTYIPDTGILTYQTRRDFFAQRGMARLWWNTDSEDNPRAGKGVYVKAMRGGTTDTYLDAHLLEYDPSDGLTQPVRMTRVELVHPSSDPAWAGADRTVTRFVTGADERRDGVRTVRMSSELLWNSYTDVAASDLEDFVQKEGGTWRLEPLTLHSRYEGFDDADQLDLLLSGGEKSELMFLQRSWLPSFGVRPIFGVMGSTITYRHPGWDVEINVSPITTTQPQHAITWEQIDDGTSGLEVRWYDDDNEHGMHESLSLDDLGYVALGLTGGTTVPADTGWDTP